MLKPNSIRVVLLLAVFSAIAMANPLMVDTILEGEEMVIPSPTSSWHLKLVTVSDTIQMAVFSLNGEYSRPLRPRERYVFSDGSILAIGNILPNEAAERAGKDIVEYYFVGSTQPTTPISRWQPLGEDAPYDLANLDEEGVSISTAPTPSALAPPALSPPPREEIPQDQCSSDDDCDDHDGCTVDTCLGRPRACLHQHTITGCSFGSAYCVPYGRSYLIPPDVGVYCRLDGAWIEQKAAGAACTADYECKDGVCTEHRCGGNPPAEQPAAPPAPAPQTPTGMWEIFLALVKRLLS